LIALGALTPSGNEGEVRQSLSQGRFMKLEPGVGPSHTPRRVEEAVLRKRLERDSCWSESLAVGEEEFIVTVKAGLGHKGRKRPVMKNDQGYMLRETEGNYGFWL
jgi:hypothetical protein